MTSDIKIPWQLASPEETSTNEITLAEKINSLRKEIEEIIVKRPFVEPMALAILLRDTLEIIEIMAAGKSKED
jgi:hypothetical protein